MFVEVRPTRTGGGHGRDPAGGHAVRKTETGPCYPERLGCCFGSSLVRKGNDTEAR
jgi:hypothetical protein